MTKEVSVTPTFYNLTLRTDDIPGLSDWMKRSQAKLTSPDIQNEMLSIILRVRYRESGSR